MKNTLAQTLYWSPRILAILFAIFISIFAVDVFGEGHGFWETLLALGMHLIPTGIIVIIILLAWRWEWLGGILFAGFGFLYLIMEWGRFDLSAYIVISGPLFLIGLLFLTNWRYRKTLRSTT